MEHIYNCYILASVVFVFFFLKIYLSWQYNYFQKRGIPTIKGIIPGLGHILPVINIQENMATLCEKFYNEAKGHSMCGFYHFCSPILLIREPEIVKNVLLTNFSSFGQNPIELSCPKKDGLLRSHPFFQNGEKWKRARATTTNGLSSLKLKMMLPLVQKSVIKINDYLQNRCRIENGSIELDLKVVFNKFTGEVSSTLTGIEVNNFQEELPSSKNEKTMYNQIIGKIFETPSFSNGIQQMMIFFAPSLARIFKFGFTPKAVDEYFRKIATTITSKRKKENLVYNDYLQFVTDYEKIHGNVMNEETLAATHMLSFAFDVYELIAINISFLMADLACHLKIQDKVRQEIVSLLEKYNGEMTYDALNEMTYFDKVLSESQRMNHILGVLYKICTKRTKLTGSDGLSCVVEPGQMVAVSLYGLQTDSKYWPEPEKFNPERFNEQEKNRHKFTFLPFGEGPRMCVGMRLSVILMKLAVSAILRDFSVELSSKMVFPLKRDKTNFLNFPKGGFWLKICPLKT